MMSYSKTNYEDVEPRAPSMYFLRDALNCENLGVTVIDADEDGKEWNTTTPTMTTRRCTHFLKGRDK